MRLKFLAISDTHLGEETSLLCFPQGRQRLWQALRDQFGDGTKARVDVDELILLGDIPDRTLSSTAQVITQTNAFMATLGSALAVKKLVYLPGNHDHTLWTTYAQEHYDADTAITSPSGELLVHDGVPIAPAAAELLSIFLGYPDGSTWRAIEEAKSLDFVAANPLYARSFCGRTYVFTHGTHFRPDVDAPEWLRHILDYLQADELLGHIEVQSGGDIRKATNLRELESIATPFVDSLWPSSKNKPTSHSDQLWYLLTAISGKFAHKRPFPLDSRLFTWADLCALNDTKRVGSLTPEYGAGAGPIAPCEKYKNGSIDRCRRYFLGKALDYIEQAGLPIDPVTFVYGDTHEGGWGLLPNPRGGEVRIYNTGAWVAHNADDHPPCHLFAVDEDGKEYLFDVSFLGVKVDNEPLLKVVSADAENRKAASSKLLHLVLKLLPTTR